LRPRQSAAPHLDLETGKAIGRFSLGAGVGVYNRIRQRSPAPPLIALVGLLGMVLGEQAVDMAKRHFAPPAQVMIEQAPDDVVASR
jgi:XapX domain-containing protein